MQMRDSFRVFSRSLVLVAAVVATGCSWFGARDTRNDPAPLVPVVSSPAQGSVAWRTPVGAGSGYGFAPAVVGDAVYAAAANGVVVRVDLSTGATVWSRNVAPALSAGVGSDGNTVVVVTPQGEVIALDAQGEIKWREFATSEVSVPPWVGRSVVLVRSGDYRLQAFNVENGERIWNVQRPGPVLALRAPSRMTTVQDLVLVGMPGGRLLAVEPIIGAVVWEGIVAVPAGSSDLDRVNDVVGIPIVEGRRLCAVAYQGRVSCFDLQEGGATIWNQRISSIVGMATDKERLFVPSARDSVVALKIDNGEVVWRQDSLLNRKLNEPAVTAGVVVLGDFEGQVHLLSAQSGEIVGRVSVGGGRMQAPALATSQGVLVQAGDSSLAMIRVN